MSALRVEDKDLRLEEEKTLLPPLRALGPLLEQHKHVLAPLSLILKL
jgi:hypothetical protein